MSRAREPSAGSAPPERATPAPVVPASPTALRALSGRADSGTFARAALSLQRTQGNRSVARALLARMPDGLKNPMFCGVRVSPGVNDKLAKALAAVEEHLIKVVWPAMPAEAKTSRKTGEPTTELNAWLGIESVAGWRHGAFHESGSAVDVDYAWGPYIATRNFDAAGKPTYGGEKAGAALVNERRRALEVNDRAMQWVGHERADLSSRRKEEAIGAAYDRFKLASDALSIWMMYAIPPDKGPYVERPPIENVHDPAKVSDEQLLAKFPERERHPKEVGVQLIKDDMERPWWKEIHPQGWPQTPEQVYFQVLRDYEMVRVPMVRGDPVALPNATRNPVHGFIHHRKALVEAMVDVGKLRWGACDLGDVENGDTHHFDLGFHGGPT